MKLYNVSNAYIDYLKTLDHKVLDNYQGKRPYIGALITIGDIKYLAPLTSPKDKHARMKDSDITLFKLKDLSNENNRLGIINLNNMIPVIDSEVSLLDVSRQPEQYKFLLQKQIAFIRKNKADIQARAERLRGVVIKGYDQRAVNLSCNFRLLEERYTQYQSN